MDFQTFGPKGEDINVDIDMHIDVYESMLGDEADDIRTTVQRIVAYYESIVKEPDKSEQIFEATVKQACERFGYARAFRALSGLFMFTGILADNEAFEKLLYAEALQAFTESME